MKNDGLIESQVLSLSYGRVVVKPVEKQRGLVPESYEGYQILDPGDIVVRPTDLQNDQTSIRIGHVKNRGIITSAYIGLHSSGDWDDLYAYQYLSVVDSSKRIYGMGRGLRQQLGWSDLKRMPCLVPPAEEQAAIVKYLAHANARIDKAIAAKRRLASLLQEQQRAHDDRDLNDLSSDNVNSVRLKSLLYEADDRSTRGDEQHLSMSQKFGLVPADRISRTLTAESMAGGRICQAGDIVLNRLKAHLGVFSVAPMSGVVSPDYTVLRTHGDVLPEFLCRKLQSPGLRPELRRRTKGIVEGFWRLYTEDFLSMRVGIPDMPSQVRIVRQIVMRDEETRRLTSKIAEEITLLQEFRTRLVADVVTGQVDVRAIAAALPDAPESFDNTVSATDDDLEEVLGEGEE
ncbi:hypothetical protein ACQUSY_08660 [Microbacterium sp. YY-03]|uniref:restriction endonuclease subunit S n=1 Tax=Microbacterium sp. YY-03 TaxID=3421636 RepID=UPI003D1817EC